MNDVGNLLLVSWLIIPKWFPVSQSYLWNKKKMATLNTVKLTWCISETKYKWNFILSSTIIIIRPISVLSCEKTWNN